jgi:hypothetical protein
VFVTTLSDLSRRSIAAAMFDQLDLVTAGIEMVDSMGFKVSWYRIGTVPHVM